jgi:hypothetical protein
MDLNGDESIQIDELFDWVENSKNFMEFLVMWETSRTGPTGDEDLGPFLIHENNKL